jgi:hypothetical protein
MARYRFRCEKQCYDSIPPASPARRLRSAAPSRTVTSIWWIPSRRRTLWSRWKSFLALQTDKRRGFLHNISRHPEHWRRDTVEICKQDCRVVVKYEELLASTGLRGSRRLPSRSLLRIFCFVMSETYHFSVSREARRHGQVGVETGAIRLGPKLCHHDSCSP